MSRGELPELPGVDRVTVHPEPQIPSGPKGILPQESRKPASVACCPTYRGGTSWHSHVSDRCCPWHDGWDKRTVLLLYGYHSVPLSGSDFPNARCSTSSTGSCESGVVGRSITRGRGERSWIDKHAVVITLSRRSSSPVSGLSAARFPATTCATWASRD